MYMRFTARVIQVQMIEISKCTSRAQEARAREVMVCRVKELKVVPSKVRMMDNQYGEAIRVRFHRFKARTLRASNLHALYNTTRCTCGATMALASLVLEHWRSASHRPLMLEIEEELVILNAPV